MNPRLSLAILTLGLTLSMCEPVAEAKQAPKPSEIMAAWYDARDFADAPPEGLVLYFGQEVERFAAVLGISQHVPTMLSMAHRESAFDQATVNGDSVNIAQVRTLYHGECYAFWAERGEELGSISDPTTQAAFLVGMFYQHLGYAKGNVNEAIARYNGGKNWRKRLPQRYLKRVLRTRRNVFGGEHVQG